MKNAPIIWMNVTTSANWNRPPVGIVRVEQSLSYELGLLYGNRFRLCIWEEGRFVEFTPFQSKNTKTITSKVDDLFSFGDVLISIGLDWDHQFYKDFYFLRNRFGLKVVTCCYDLIPVLYPQYCVSNVATLFSNYFLEIADASDLILCISKNTEKDLLKLLNDTGAAIPLTHVFPLADNVPILYENEISDEIKKIVSEPFIIFVSTIERRKNHEVLYRAYHLLCADGLREELPKLVFVGMQGWGVGDILKDIELDPLTNGLIVMFNHVSDAELRALYEGCLFCVYPSLYEGWGLPVGEALALGKPVLSSDRGSLTEVGGDLVTYIDPWTPREWASNIYSMATNSDKRSYQESNIKLAYSRRNWRDSAISVANAIDQL